MTRRRGRIDAAQFVPLIPVKREGSEHSAEGLGTFAYLDPGWPRRKIAPESESMYDSDMAYLGNGNPAVEENIAVMKRWAKEER